MCATTAPYGPTPVHGGATNGWQFHPTLYDVVAANHGQAVFFRYRMVKTATVAAIIAPAKRSTQFEAAQISDLIFRSFSNFDRTVGFWCGAY